MKYRVFIVSLICLLNLFITSSFIVSAQNYQQMIIGNWVRDYSTMTIVSEGVRYEIIITNKEDDFYADKFNFKNNGILEVNTGIISKGKYSIYEKNLTLSYAPFGSSDPEEFDYMISFLSEKELILNQTDNDVLTSEDAEWILNETSFNKDFKSFINSIIGKRVSFIITIHHKKQ